MKPTKDCINRLNREYRWLSKEPVPNIIAKPDPCNILEWHFAIEGAAGTPYEGGVYHGKLIFPPEYPFKPPGIFFVTPSGRFQPYVKICFSFSDYHPECWNPAWNAGSILNATLSFMSEESSTTGSMTASPAQRRQLAEKSLESSCKSPIFLKLFPEFEERLHSTAKETHITTEEHVPPVAQDVGGDRPANHGATLTQLSVAIAAFAIVLSVLLQYMMLS